MNRVRTIGKVILEKYHDRFFTMERIIEATKISRRDVRYIMIGFVREGLVTKVKKVKKPEREWCKPPLYTIIYRLANRKRMEERIAPKQRPDTVQDKMWFVIRKIRVFSRHDLVTLTSDKKGNPTVAYETARWYTKALRKAGYIKAGVRGEWVRIKDVGPKRPYIGDQTKRS